MGDKVGGGRGGFEAKSIPLITHALCRNGLVGVRSRGVYVSVSVCVFLCDTFRDFNHAKRVF